MEYVAIRLQMADQAITHGLEDVDAQYFGCRMMGPMGNSPTITRGMVQPAVAAVRCQRAPRRKRWAGRPDSRPGHCSNSAYSMEPAGILLH